MREDSRDHLDPASEQTLGPLAARRAAHAERQGGDLTVEAMTKQCWRGRLRRVEEEGLRWAEECQDRVARGGCSESRV